MGKLSQRTTWAGRRHRPTTTSIQTGNTDEQKTLYIYTLRRTIHSPCCRNLETYTYFVITVYVLCDLSHRRSHGYKFKTNTSSVHFGLSLCTLPPRSIKQKSWRLQSGLFSVELNSRKIWPLIKRILDMIPKIGQ